VRGWDCYGGEDRDRIWRRAGTWDRAKDTPSILSVVARHRWIGKQRLSSLVRIPSQSFLTNMLIPVDMSRVPFDLLLYSTSSLSMISRLGRRLSLMNGYPGQISKESMKFALITSDHR
jgi:hypothetical protein